MIEVQQLRQQLSSMIDSSVNHSPDLAVLSQKPKPDDLERVNQIVAAGFIDQVAIRADLLKDGNAGFGRKPRRAIEVAYRTLIPTTPDSSINTNTTPEERELHRSVFIHPSSVLARLSVREMPEYIVYKHLSRAATATIDGRAKKTRMWPLTAVSARQLAALAEGTPLLEVGKPIGKIEELGGRRRRCWVDVGMRAGEGEMVSAVLSPKECCV